MATIYDIAKHCGISAATVSYVINGRGAERRISTATQEKVQKAAKELGYKRTRHKSKIMIAVYWLNKHLDSSMQSMINGINAAILSENGHVDTIIKPYDQGHIDKQESLWISDSADVAVIIAAGANDLEYLEKNLTAMPTILINRSSDYYTTVSIDNLQAGQLAARHALKKGGDDIALVLNPSSLYGLDYRGQAIINTCKEQGVNICDNLLYCENDIDDGYGLGWELVRKNQLKKVIICIYDMVALGLMSALNEAGVEVGKEVQIIATSTGIPRLFARSTPPMTVIDLKTEETVERAIKMAISLATHRLIPPQKVIIYPSIIYRQSCPIEDLLSR